MELPQIDATAAALLGAAIGGGASIIAGTIGPWIKDAIERRARNRAELRTITRNEVLAVIDAMASLHRARLTMTRSSVKYAEIHASAAVAITRLTLLISKRDHNEMQRMLSFAHDTISSNDNTTIVNTTVQASATILARWYRGELRGKQIGDEFERWLKDLKTTT